MPSKKQIKIPTPVPSRRINPSKSTPNWRRFKVNVVKLLLAIADGWFVEFNPLALGAFSARTSSYEPVDEPLQAADESRQHS
jgi:hypothetical protein